ERTDCAIAEGDPRRPRRLGRERKYRSAVLHQRLARLLGPIPFEHGEFGMMQRAALAIAKGAGELDDPSLAGRQKFLAGEFGRGAQIKARASAGWRHQVCPECMEMGFIAWRKDQRRSLDLDEISRREKLPQRGCNTHACQ